MSPRGRLIVIMAVLTLLPAAVSPATAQGRLDPADTQRKLLRSAELQRQALQGLGDLASAQRQVQGAWDELKGAQDQMVLRASNAKFQDPLYPANYKRTEDALHLLLISLDALKARDKWSDSDLAAALRNWLQQSLRLTNTVAATAY